MPAFSIVALLVLGLLIAGVVLLFVKLRAKAWWIVGPMAGFVVLAAMAMSWVNVAEAPTPRSYRDLASPPPTAHSRTTGQSGSTDTIEVSRSMTPLAPEEWSGSGDDVAEAFLADVYPSAVDAARGAARSVYRSAGNPRLPSIETIGNADSEVREAVLGALNGSGGARKMNCAVTVDGNSSGTVQVVLEMPGKPVSVTTRFVSKPWAANFARYVADVNKPVVRAGSSPVGSFEEAQSEAFADAARQLEPYVRSALASAAASPTTGSAAAAAGHGAPYEIAPGPGSDASSQLTRDVILSELRSGKLVLDRFGQQFDRPYGRLWRQQLLVDASPVAMRTVAMEISNRQAIAARKAAFARDAQRQTWWSLFVRLGGLAVLIFAVYLVLNAATKGYYTAVLRVLAIGAIVAAVAVLVVIS